MQVQEVKLLNILNIQYPNHNETKAPWSQLLLYLSSVVVANYQNMGQCDYSSLMRPLMLLQTHDTQHTAYTDIVATLYTYTITIGQLTIRVFSEPRFLTKFYKAEDQNLKSFSAFYNCYIC